ncbi:MAG TPA: TIM barrel protein [Chloroflexota bacterium]|nr:TIM barrel protein [Chloroflexota bacterium]
MYLGIMSAQFINAAVRPRFRENGLPLRNTTGRLPLFFETASRPAVDPNDPLGWMIAHARELGLSAIEGHLDYKNPAEVDRIGNLLAKHNVKLGVDYWDNYFEPEKYKGPDEFLAFIRAVKPLGIRFIGTGVAPITLNRFVEDPPLEQQMETIVKGMAPLAQVAEAEGVYLGIENHADYRCVEIKRYIIDPLGSRHVGFKLDTGNCPLVIDDVIDATEIAAPLCYSTHFKDMYVVPNCPEGAKVMGAPVGHGSLKLAQVGRMIAEQAPFPDELILGIEIGWYPPNEDFFKWFEESVRWCHETLGQYLTL